MGVLAFILKILSIKFGFLVFGLLALGSYF